jgi:hypothetical protein
MEHWKAILTVTLHLGHYCFSVLHNTSYCTQWSAIIVYYLTLCTFSFEINESRLSDTKCLIQDVVSPHCGDKRMARRCTRHSLPNYLVMTSYHWNVRENTWHRWMNDKITWRHARNVVSRLYIRSCLLRELTASQLIAIATRSDTGSHNRLDLIQSIVPPHYVCNGYLSHVKIHGKTYKS